MNITYSLKIDELRFERAIAGYPDVVSSAIWTLTGEAEDGLVETTSASTEFPAPVEGSDFTPAAALKEDVVIGWVETHAKEGDLDGYRKVVADKIAALRDPYVPPKMPWKVDTDAVSVDDAPAE